MITRWEDLPIGKYLKICEITQDGAEDLGELDVINRQTQLLTVLMDKTAEEVEKLPLPEYIAHVNKLEFLHKDIENVKDNFKANEVVKVRDWSLVVASDIAKWTTAQYIDFQTLSKESDNNIIPLLAIFLVPQGKNYAQDYDIEKLKQDIADYLPCTLAVRLSAFFFRECENLMGNLRISLERATNDLPKEKRMKAKAMLKMLKEHLDGIGVGLRAWMR